MSADYACVRCEEPFKWEQLTQTAEGNLFCSKCWHEFKSEPKRLCPVDGIEMDKLIIAEIVNIDRCSTCGGTWFDGGELEVIQKQSQAKGRSEGFFLGWLF